MPEDRAPAAKDQIPTNLRLLLIMEEVARAGIPVSPTSLADKLGLPKPTIHRLLATAEEEGYLQRAVDGRSYGPGRRLRRLATHTLSSQRIRTERLLIMQELAEEVGETCNLAAANRFGMVYIDRVETHWPLRIQLPVGTQVPFHCTASGKLYLSSLRTDKLKRLLGSLPMEQRTEKTHTRVSDLMDDLSDIRARGYSTDNEEFMLGMCAVAVAIRDTEGRLLTTLSVHAPDQRRSLESLLDTLPPLREAAHKLEDVNDS